MAFTRAGLLQLLWPAVGCKIQARTGLLTNGLATASRTRTRLPHVISTVLTFFRTHRIQSPIIFIHPAIEARRWSSAPVIATRFIASLPHWIKMAEARGT